MATPSGPSLFVPTIPGRNSCLNLSLAKNALLSRSPSPHSSDPGNFLRHLDHLGLRHRPRQHHLAIPVHDHRLQPLQARHIARALIRLYEVARAAHHILVAPRLRVHRSAPIRPRPPRRSRCRSSAHPTPRQCAADRYCCRGYSAAGTQHPRSSASEVFPASDTHALAVDHMTQNLLRQRHLVVSADQHNVHLVLFYQQIDHGGEILRQPLPHDSTDTGMHSHHRLAEQRAHGGRNAGRQLVAPSGRRCSTAEPPRQPPRSYPPDRSRSSLTWLCLRRS